MINKYFVYNKFTSPLYEHT